MSNSQWDQDFLFSFLLLFLSWLKHLPKDSACLSNALRLMNTCIPSILQSGAGARIHVQSGNQRFLYILLGVIFKVFIQNCAWDGHLRCTDTLIRCLYGSLLSFCRPINNPWALEENNANESVHYISCKYKPHNKYILLDVLLCSITEHFSELCRILVSS